MKKPCAILMVILLSSAFLLLPNKMVGAEPVYAYVHLRSRAYDGLSNVGSIWVEGVGQKDLPADIYMESGQYLVMGSGGMLDGERYSFDKWEVSRGLEVSNPSREDPTITVSGEGTLTLVLFKWNFALDVSPLSRTVMQGDGAIYSVTTTATGGWTTDTGQSVTVDVESLGEPPDTTANGPGLFHLSQSSPTDVNTYTIYTAETTSTDTYDITLKGTITSTTTSHFKTVQLVVEPHIELLPDLIILDFWWEPSSPNPGDHATFTYIEKNQGNGDAPAHKNTLWIDDYPISNDVVDALYAGASRTRAFPDTWTATAGAHDAMVKADGQDAIAESDEENNVLPKTIGTKEQISTNLAASLNPPSIPPNTRRRITISGRLTQSGTGAGIDDRRIHLEWTGGLTTVTTNTEGYYAYSTDVGPYTERLYEFIARFEGYETPSTISLPSTGSAFLSVGKIATSLTITLDRSSIEENAITDVTLDGRLTRADNGAGLGDEAIDFNYGWGGSASATTNENGYYSKAVRVSLSKGSYLVSASFEGDSTHGSSSDSTLLHVQEVLECDLTILEISWSPEDPSDGDKVFFSYIVRNDGTDGTTDFTNALYIDGERISTSARRSMAAGETLDRSFTNGWTAVEGSHDITVVADDLNEIPESKENNNEMSKDLIVLPVLEIPDLQDWYLSSYDVNPGDTVTCSYLIYNPNSHGVTTWLGATVRDPFGQPYLDETNDVSVNLTPGASWHSRSFKFSAAAMEVWYDYALAIWADQYVTQWDTTGWIVDAISVSLPFDFQLSADQSSRTVHPGESASYMILVDLEDGDPETVALSLYDPPSWVTYGFSPSSDSPTFTSTLTVTASISAPAGSHSLSVGGEGGGLDRTIEVTLNVEVEEPKGPPGTYVWTFWEKSGNYNFDVDVETTNAPEKDVHVLYWAHQFWFLDGEGGYLGLQIVGSQKKAIFSIWGAIDGTPGEFIEEDGEVWRCLIDYEWELDHKYRLRIWYLDKEQNGDEWWIGAVYDYTSGIETTIGKILVPSSWGWLKSPSVTWIEYAGYNDFNPEDIPYTRAIFSNLYARHAEKSGAAQKLQVSYGTSPSSNSDVDYYSGTTYALEAGNNVVRDTPEGWLSLEQGAYDFSVAVSPPLQDVVRGDTINYNVTVTPLSGSGIVSLGLSGLPPNVGICGFDPDSEFAGFTSTLTIETFQTAPTGSYSLTVTGSGESVIHYASFTLVVEPRPPHPKADLILMDILWTPSSLSVGQSVSFSYVIKNQGTGGTTDFANALYIDGERIYISARRSLATGETQTRSFTYAWTATEGSHSITVVADDLNEISESYEDNNAMSKTLLVPPERAHPTPNLISPSNGATANTNVAFSWSNSEGATDYQIEINGPTSRLEIVHSTSYTATLSPGSYKWKVRAHSSAGWSDWASARSLTVASTSPSIDSIASKYAKDDEDFIIVGANLGNIPYSVILYYPSFVSNPRIGDLTGSIVVKDSTMTPLIASSDLTNSFIVKSSVTLALGKMRSWSATDPSYWKQLSDLAGGSYVSLIVMFAGTQILWITVDSLTGTGFLDMPTRVIKIGDFVLSQVDVIANLGGSTALVHQAADSIIFLKDVADFFESFESIYIAYKMGGLVPAGVQAKLDSVAKGYSLSFFAEAASDYAFTDDIGGMSTTWLMAGQYCTVLGAISENMVSIVNSMSAGTATPAQIYAMLEYKILYARYALATWQTLENMYQTIFNKGWLNMWYWTLDAPNSLKHYRALYSNWIDIEADFVKQRADFYSALDRCYQESIVRATSASSSVMPMVNYMGIVVFAVAVAIRVASPRLLVMRARKLMKRRRRI